MPSGSRSEDPDGTEFDIKAKKQVKTCSQSSCSFNDNSITKEKGLVSTHRYRRTWRPRSFKHQFHGLAFSHHETLVIGGWYFCLSKCQIDDSVS